MRISTFNAVLQNAWLFELVPISFIVNKVVVKCKPIRFKSDHVPPSLSAGMTVGALTIFATAFIASS